MHADTFSTSRAAGDLIVQAVLCGVFAIAALAWALDLGIAYRRHRKAVDLRRTRARLAAHRRAGSPLATLPRVQLRVVWSRPAHDPRPVYMVERAAEPDAAGRFI